jgi:hypothetical protein
MTRLTIEQIEAIRERAKKATVGPWYFDGQYELYATSDGLGPVKLRNRLYPRNNFEFIANARQDIPALLAEVEYLNGVIGSLRASLGEIWHYVEGNGNLLVQEAIKHAEESLR